MLAGKRLLKRKSKEKMISKLVIMFFYYLGLFSRPWQKNFGFLREEHFFLFLFPLFIVLWFGTQTVVQNESIPTNKIGKYPSE